MKEREIEQYLKKRVRLVSGQTRKVRWIGCDGAPDRVVMCFGRLYWVELKSSTGRLSPAQVREHQVLRIYDQTVYVFSSKAQIDHFFDDRLNAYQEIQEITGC